MRELRRQSRLGAFHVDGDGCELASTYSTLFALLASTGLRVSEAIHFRLDDITPDGLVIRCSKFRKSRLVPLHETARAGLERYVQRRRTYWYLEAVPEPMTDIAERCERFVMGGRP